MGSKIPEGYHMEPADYCIYYLTLTEKSVLQNLQPKGFG